MSRWRAWARTSPSPAWSRSCPRAGGSFTSTTRSSNQRAAREGPASLQLGRLRLESLFTSDALDALFCVIRFGASDFRCGLLSYPGASEHAHIESTLFSARLTLAQLLRQVDRFFTGRDYSLRDLFLDGRRRVATALLADTRRRYEADYQAIFDDNRQLMLFMREIDSPIPSALRVAADESLTQRLLTVTGSALRGDIDLDAAEPQLLETVDLSRTLEAHLDVEPVRRDVEKLVRSRMAAMIAGRGPLLRAEELVGILQLSQRLGLWLDLWATQNQFWEWVAAQPAALDPATLTRLAPLLWFEPTVLSARRGGAG